MVVAPVGETLLPSRVPKTEVTAIPASNEPGLAPSANPDGKDDELARYTVVPTPPHTAPEMPPTTTDAHTNCELGQHLYRCANVAHDAGPEDLAQLLSVFRRVNKPSTGIRHQQRHQRCYGSAAG